MSKEQSSKRSSLVDARGQPLQKTVEQTEEFSPDQLDRAIKLYIENEVREAIAIERQQLDRNWRLLKQIGAATGISLLGALGWIWSDVPRQVRKQFIEPKISKSVDEIITKKAAVYVDTRLTPLQTTVAETAALADSTKTEITRKQTELVAEQAQLASRQAQLTSAQDQLSIQITFQQRATAAKSGDSAAYDDLTKSASKNDNSTTANAAALALSEVELYYDADRSQMFPPYLVDSISKQDIGASLDELLVVLAVQRDAKLRAAAANTIYDQLRQFASKQTGCVEELISFLRTEHDLRVIARLTRTLEIATGEKFRPLDREKVIRWWETAGHDEPRFRSPYGGVIKANLAMQRDSVFSSVASDNAGFLPLLDQTIDADSDAVFARCQRAFILITEDRLEDAEQEFQEVQKRRPEFRWLLFWRPVLLERQHKIEEAITELNATLKKWPGLVDNARLNPTFQSLLASGKIEWPPKPQAP